MKDKLGIRDRRHLDRLRMNYPATYTRLNMHGKPREQKIARLMDVSLKGVRLQSTSPVDSGEMLDISLALGARFVTFRGKAIHVTLSENQGFELGISIEDIEDQQRIALIRFLSWIQEQVEYLG